MEKKIIYSLIMAFALTCVTSAAVSAQDYVSAPVTVSKDNNENTSERISKADSIVFGYLVAFFIISPP